MVFTQNDAFLNFGSQPPSQHSEVDDTVNYSQLQRETSVPAVYLMVTGPLLDENRHTRDHLDLDLHRLLNGNLGLCTMHPQNTVRYKRLTSIALVATQAQRQPQPRG
ncbi:hypothetical protein BG000_001795 [Podila horticola]|nr:hypothetical protein BG000_001795 [Podila horticola]